MNYEKSLEVQQIAEKLIETLDCPFMQSIREAQPVIAYRVGDGKKSKGGMITHADCEKVKPSNKQYMAYDYIITVYEKNCEYMTPEQMELLIYHELLHIKCHRYEDGRLECRIRPHDIQDFTQITQKYDEYWSCEGAVVESIYDKLGVI